MQAKTPLFLCSLAAIGLLGYGSHATSSQEAPDSNPAPESVLESMPTILSKPTIVRKARYKDLRGIAQTQDGFLLLADIGMEHIYIRGLDQMNLLWMDEGPCSGITFGWDNKLLACMTRANKLVRVHQDEKDPKIKILETLASETPDGMPLNGPNDLVLDSSGGIYFTDPDYMHDRKTAWDQGVYYLSKTGKLTLVLNDLHRPNGIALSPDEQTLYITPGSDSKLVTYPIIIPGLVGKGRVLTELDCPGDGITTDAGGNIYVTQPTENRVNVYSDTGQFLLHLNTGEKTTDVEFGGPEQTWVFIGTTHSLYAYELNTTGYKAYEADLPYYLMEDEHRERLTWGLGIAFLDSLTEKKEQLAMHDWDDPGRTTYSFLAGKRSGLPYYDLTKDQRVAFEMFLEASMGRNAYQTLRELRAAESNAHDAGREDIGPHDYWISFFGTPTPNSTWSWRLEGHHLSLNVTFQNGEIVSMTPMFMGSQPEMISEGVLKGTRPLGSEGAKARSLLMKLDEQQRAKAIVSTTPQKEIVATSDSKPWNNEAAGLSASEMTKEQQEKLLALIRLYVQRTQVAFSKDYMQEHVTPHIDDITFAWYGSTKPNEAHSYQITSPDFIIEYNDAKDTFDHVHTVWRDRTRDYGQHVVLAPVQAQGEESKQ